MTAGIDRDHLATALPNVVSAIEEEGGTKKGGRLVTEGHAVVLLAKLGSMSAARGTGA